ncbi:hypothetical protein SARC_13935 [Sphaeroforma arctica JP610]|uniref:Uncharacterized protein n=1 Tax=Sphaeroforma arctica JP610 TaxID=667725 RepID=A0A0L0F9V2_9EUKA|nr:hypothetical protein SARC_13935 [Sphaeroforma arctica JP610]KNC73507.1 hypothetical protein SARC_13935 [Sphaeroforma arctica JP610]|eukprot:XP_014147409.1 hypothetical protein SARC_13935 [Sphaeroforma arctica JP610]
MVTRIEFTDTGIVQDRDVLVVVEEEGSDHAHTVNATTVTQYSAGASAGVNTQQQQAELKRRRDIVRLATVEVMGDLATAGEAEVSAVATRCTADRPGVVEKEKGVSGAAPAGNAAGEQEGVVSINRTESSPPAAHMRVTNGVGNSPSGVERLSENEVSHGMSETARQGTTEAPFNDRTDDTRARTMNGEAIPMFGGGAAVSEVPAHDATHTINRELVSDGLGVGNEACGNRADSSTRPVEVTETAPGGTEASSATAEPGTGQLAGADALVTTLEANDANAQRNTIGSVLKAADEGAGVLDLGMANVRDADDGSLDVVQALHSEDWEDWEHVETPMLRVDAAGVDQFFDDVIDACLGQPTLKIERLRAALVRTIGVYIQEFDRQVMVDDLRICLRNVLQ